MKEKMERYRLTETLLRRPPSQEEKDSTTDADVFNWAADEIRNLRFQICRYSAALVCMPCVEKKVDGKTVSFILKEAVVSELDMLKKDALGYKPDDQASRAEKELELLLSKAKKNLSVA